MKKMKIEWSKLLLLILFLNAFLIEIFTGCAIWHSFSVVEYTQQVDFTPLITLISAVVGQTFAYGIYCSKSKAENLLKIQNTFEEFGGQEDEIQGPD